VKAFITGLGGQDSFYLSELLLDKGYDVYGLVRRTVAPKELPEGVKVVSGDITDPNTIRLVLDVAPDEIYNLAAMSFVHESFNSPKATFDINAGGALNMLEATRYLNCKFYQASTSELFGSSPPPQHERTYFHPRSPYGIAKLAAHWSTINYREAYNLHASTGILFNHESPRRGAEFVTQKIVQGVANIVKGKQERLALGNLEAIRDWGHAKDYVKGMWLMLQQPEPGDYVLATGEGRSIRDLLDIAFSYVDLEYTHFVDVDPKFYRPTEVNALIGDPSRAEGIGWEREYTFEMLIEEMLDAALQSDN